MRLTHRLHTDLLFRRPLWPKVCPWFGAKKQTSCKFLVLEGPFFFFQILVRALLGNGKWEWVLRGSQQFVVSSLFYRKNVHRNILNCFGHGRRTCRFVENRYAHINVFLHAGSFCKHSKRMQQHHVSDLAKHMSWTDAISKNSSG